MQEKSLHGDDGILNELREHAWVGIAERWERRPFQTEEHEQRCGRKLGRVRENRKCCWVRRIEWLECRKGGDGWKGWSQITDSPERQAALCARRPASLSVQGPHCHRVSWGGTPPPQLFALGHKNSPEIGFSLVPWRIFHRPQDTSPEIPVPSRGHGKFQGSLGEVRALGIFIRDKGNSLTPLHPQKSR